METSTVHPMLSSIRAKGLQSIYNIHSIGKWSRAVRAFAQMKRWLHNEKLEVPLGRDSKPEPTQAWIWRVTMDLIRVAQHEAFGFNMTHYAATGKWQKNSTLLNMNAYLDEDGVLRSNSRTRNQHWISEVSRRPIIMPRDHRVTLLIARRQHHLEGHGTSADKLALKLQAIFWIKGIRALTSTVTKGCIECQKMNKQHGNQIMGCPPNLKMMSIKPFTIVSMDFAGPFKALLCRKVLKLYVLVCVCQQSKACHLELTMGMDAEALILAIERIVGRRGTIDKVHSDNGGNFAHTGKLLTPDEEELNSTLKEVDWKKVQNDTSGESGIKEWTFSQPLNAEATALPKPT
jgi:hypothetical protein